MLTQRTLFISLSLALFAASASADPLLDVVTINYNNFTGQFGTLDPMTGAFNEIGPVTADPLSGLVPGPNGNLLSISVSGNLDSINPTTGAISVIGATGLGNLAFTTAELNGTVYATDLNNNLYTVNKTTGVATLIGPTGIPPCPSLTNPADVSDEMLFTSGGKLYAAFDGINLTTLAPVDSPKLYEINTATGVAAVVGPTALGLDAAAFENGTLYAFDFGYTGSNSILSLNPSNGNTTFVTDYSLNGFNVTGAAATPAPEPASLGLGLIGIAAVIARQRRLYCQQG